MTGHRNMESNDYEHSLGNPPRTLVLSPGCLGQVVQLDWIVRKI